MPATMSSTFRTLTGDLGCNDYHQHITVVFNHIVLYISYNVPASKAQRELYTSSINLSIFHNKCSHAIP